MNKNNLLRLLLIVTASAFLATGCASTPAPKPVPVEPEPVSVTPIPDEPAIQPGGEYGFGDQPIEDVQAGDARNIYADAPAEMQRIYFEYDQFTLSAEARDTLASNAAYLMANPSAEVRIEGHCDERGSDEYNLALGERRAAATKAYLNSIGIDASRVSIISYGEEMPLDPERTESAWAKNRRAEFKQLR